MKRFDIIEKLFIKLSILTVGILFTSCDKISNDDWVILNDTEYLITVYAYDTDREDDLFDETFLIQANTEFIVPKGNSGRDKELPGIFKYPEIDSVDIIFDNKRIITQACEYEGGVACQYPRNIMDYNNRDDYVETETSTNTYRYTYTITQADYERAIPMDAK